MLMIHKPFLDFVGARTLNFLLLSKQEGYSVTYFPKWGK